MPTLHDIEYAFLQGICNSETSILTELDESNRPAAGQLSTYRKSIFGGLLKALAEIYPVSEKLVGYDFFQALCLRYIRQTPSLSFDLNDYGSDLHAFTRSFPHTIGLPYLPDVMRLEWAWHHAFQAPDYANKDLSDLAHLPFAELEHCVLLIHPTGSLLQSPYPIQRIWESNQDRPDDNPVNLDEGAVHLFVWRDRNDMHIDILTESMYLLIKAIQSQTALGDIFDAAIPAIDENLPAILQRGYINDYRLLNPSKN